MQEFRTFLLETLSQHFDQKDAVIYEKAIFNMSHRLAKRQSVKVVSNDPDFIRILIENGYDQLGNLMNGDPVKVLEDIRADRAEWQGCGFKSIREKQQFYDKVTEEPIRIKKDGVVQCRKCKQYKTFYTQAQTRGADEPMTLFVTCTRLECGYKFRQAG